jgi:hypothetical protein
MFCKNCGKELADDTRFCDGCGTATGDVAPAQKAGFDFQPIINKIKTDKKAMAMAILAIIHLVQFIMLFCPIQTIDYGWGQSTSISLFKESSTMLGIVLIIMTMGGLILTALRILDTKLGNFNLAAAQKVNSVVACALLLNLTVVRESMAFCGWLTLIFSLIGLIIAANQFNEKK